MEQSGLKFLADECFSPVLIRILKHLGEKSIQPFKPNFEHGTPDEVWIPQATQRGYICITLDRRMLGAENIAVFFAQAKARVVFIGSHLANMRRWDQALWLLKYWHRIRERAGTMTAGELVKVLRYGRIVPVAPKPTQSDKAAGGRTRRMTRRRHPPAKLPGLFD